MRKETYWLAGTIGGAGAFGFAAFVGTGAGHGSDIPALVTIAPLSIATCSLDQVYILPIVAWICWGAVAFLSRPSASRRSAGAGLALVALHLLSTLTLDLSSIPTRHLVISLAPHLLLLAALVASASIALIRRRSEDQ